MKKFLRSMFGVALLAGLCTSVIAADKPTPEEAFKKHDKNSDGKISLDEFKGKREGDKAAKAEQTFKAKDKDSDGFLTLEEFKAKK